jgi:meso-butanediol dehydrogenase/(S,S)-butanediol dehydrogenase/diacetyl reductase
MWAETMSINVTAVWRMSRLALPALRAAGKGACIINNASDAGLVMPCKIYFCSQSLAFNFQVGEKNMAAYCASKGAVVQLTRAMALDLAKVPLLALFFKATITCAVSFQVQFLFHHLKVMAKQK